MEKNKLAFVGCGVIGAGLAVNAMLAGFPVALYDNGDLDVVKKSIREILDMFVENGAYTRQQADEAAARAVYTQDLAEAVKDAVFVQESIIERLDIKRDLYRQIQTLAGDKIVIGSSASNLIPTQLQEGALFPDKIVLGPPTSSPWWRSSRANRPARRPPSSPRRSTPPWARCPPSR